MSSIIFGYTMSMASAATPSTGFLVAYDLDGIIKQKDSNGVITPIGGGPTAGLSSTQSLSQTLAVGNYSDSYSIEMGPGTSVTLGTGSNINSINGSSALYLDYNSLSDSLYLTNGNHYVSITNATFSIVNTTGTTLNISNGTNYMKFDSVTDIFSNSQIRLRVFNNSDEILLKSNVGTSVTSANSTATAIFIGSQNSTISQNIVNSVVIGGVGQSAVANNSVYIPDLYIQDSKRIRGSIGDASLRFTSTNDTIIENSNSILAIVSSTSSETISVGGIIVSDTIQSITSSNVDSSVSFISTKNSSFAAGVVNSVIIGGENLINSQTNSVVLGEYVNINNQYTFPTTDGLNNEFLSTDGSGNLTWKSAVAGLDEVLAVNNSSEGYSIQMGTAQSIYSANGAGKIELDYLGVSNSVFISVNDANIWLDENDLILSANDHIGLASDSASVLTSNGEGLVYGFDYSSSFVTYSLVDKNYVDTSINTLGAQNGVVEITSGTFGLGGTLSQNTTIYGNTYNFQLTGANGIELGSSSSTYPIKLRSYQNDYDSNIQVESNSSGISLSTQLTGNTYSYAQVDTSKIRFLTVDGTLFYQMWFEINNTPQTINDGSTDNTMIIVDGYQKGLVYRDDYTSNFTTYSLVTKGYVDSVVSAVGATNGLDELSNGIIGLGGTLSQNTFINGNNFDFKIEGSNEISFTASIGTGYDYLYLGNGSILGTTDGLSFAQISSGITNITLFYQDSTGTFSAFESNSNGTFMYINDGISQSNIQIYNTNQIIGAGDGSSDNRMIIQDQFASKGLVYYDDYSANFTTYSLVTKGYVDTQLATSTTKYSEVRGFTASIAETITHSLGTEEIIVQAWESGVMVIPGDVIIVDTNSVDIRFYKTLSNIKIIVIG